MTFHAFALIAMTLTHAAQGDRADDIQIIRERLIARYLPTDPSAVEKSVANARSVAGRLTPEGAWPEIAYDDQGRSRWATGGHLSHMLELATAHRVLNDSGQPDESLKAAALSALDYWLKRDPKNPNWWWNQIGTQLSLGPTALLLGDDLDASRRAQVVEIMKRSTWPKWTGQNLVWGVTIQIMRGCIESDPAVIEEAYGRMYQEMTVVPPGAEGIQADFSFHQHGSQLYSGGYGLVFAANGAEFIHHARGTRFAAPAEVVETITRYMLDGQQWMMRAQTFDYSAVGREIVRSGKNGGSMAHAANLMAELGGPRAGEFEAFAARVNGFGKEAPFTGNRHFWRSDYMAHHRPAYMVSVRMASTRNRRSELVNDEGRYSHHLADGAMYLYRSGREYYDIFPAWDWQRVPGITAEQADWAQKGNVGGAGETDFVGGVSDGGYGMAAMDFRRGALAARKAWFCFDDAIVCLGAGITCSSENPVLTSVNQCLLNGAVTSSAAAEPLGPGRHELAGPAWFHHDGVGYAVPQEAAVVVADETQRGAWADIGVGPTERLTQDVFSAWIAHGPKPSGGSYVYLVYPAVSVEAMPALAGAADIAVLSNTPAAQAVEHASLGIVQSAFYEPAEITCVDGAVLRAEKPCLVQLRTVDGAIHAAVSNPGNATLDVTLEYVGNDGTARRAVVSLPDGPLAGSTVTRVLE